MDNCNCADIVLVRNELEALSESFDNPAVWSSRNELERAHRDWLACVQRENALLSDDPSNEFCPTHAKEIPGDCYTGFLWLSWRDYQDATIRSLVEAWTLVPIAQQHAVDDVRIRGAQYIDQLARNIKRVQSDLHRAAGAATRADDLRQQGDDTYATIIDEWRKLVADPDTSDPIKTIARKYAGLRGYSKRSIQIAVRKYKSKNEIT